MWIFRGEIDSKTSVFHPHLVSITRSASVRSGSSATSPSSSLPPKNLSRWWPWLQKLPSWKMKDLKNQFIYKTHVIHVFFFFFSFFSYLVAAICFSVHFCARSGSTCQNGGHSLSEVYHHVQIILSQLRKNSLHSIWGKVQKKSSRRFLIDNKLSDNLAASSLHQVLLMLSTEVQRCACSTAGVARWWTNPLQLYLAHPSATERGLAGWETWHPWAAPIWLSSQPGSDSHSRTPSGWSSYKEASCNFLWPQATFSGTEHVASTLNIFFFAGCQRDKRKTLDVARVQSWCMFRSPILRLIKLAPPLKLGLSLEPTLEKWLSQLGQRSYNFGGPKILQTHCDSQSFSSC